MRFNSVNGKMLVAQRSYLMSKQKGTITFKTLESFLQTRNKFGEKISINHTCVEIERQVPELLGVSKSVLENVIFCH